MRIKKETEIEKLALILARTGDRSKALRTAKRLTTISKKLHTLAEVHCSRDLTDAETRLIEKYRKEAERIGMNYGFKARVNGDPRGHGLKLNFHDHTLHAWNGWGGHEDGWQVVA